MTYYLDTSALLKLVVAEPESAAMRSWWDVEQDNVLSSDLLRTEALRATRRISPAAVAAARAVLDALPLLRLDPLAYEQAGIADPPSLRSLDALHLVAATALGDLLEGIVTYDARLAEAAERQGHRVVAPA